MRFVTGLTMTLLAMTAAPAMAASGADSGAAIETASSGLSANQFVWNDTATGLDPVVIVVSIPLQRAYVYRGKTLVAATTVSSGRDGKDTPIGTYTILQKDAMHKSNLYNAAPMPFMQRLTWDGIAIHAGRNPGFPDSHGCIRVPAAFAKKLFGVTNVGTTVIVTDAASSDPIPVEPAAVAPDRDTVDANAQQLASLDSHGR